VAEMNFEALPFAKISTGDSACLRVRVCIFVCARARFRVFLCSRCACYFASDINCVQLWIALFVELQVLETFN
jgi:hypothetical protein